MVAGYVTFITYKKSYFSIFTCVNTLQHTNVKCDFKKKFTSFLEFRLIIAMKFLLKVKLQLNVK